MHARARYVRLSPHISRQRNCLPFIAVMDHDFYHFYFFFFFNIFCSQIFISLSFEISSLPSPIPSHVVTSTKGREALSVPRLGSPARPLLRRGRVPQSGALPSTIGEGSTVHREEASPMNGTRWRCSECVRERLRAKESRLLGF